MLLNETQAVASPEITDDSDGLVATMADSTTTPVAEESQHQEVAIANTTTANSRARHRISLNDDVYSQIKQLAQSQDKSMTQIVNDALGEYLKNLE